MYRGGQQHRGNHIAQSHTYDSTCESLYPQPDVRQSAPKAKLKMGMAVGIEPLRRFNILLSYDFWRRRRDSNPRYRCIRTTV